MASDKIQEIRDALEAAGARTMLEQNHEGYRATLGTATEWVWEQGAIQDLAGVEAFFRTYGRQMFDSVVLP